jgi:RHS repeat-associated protein
VTGHDAAYGPGKTARGNATAVGRWLDTDGSTLFTYSRYDTLGNVISAKDARGNVTTISYADNFGAGDNPDGGAGGDFGSTFALPTLITSPPPKPGQQQHTAKSQYDFSAGLLTGFKDRNGVITKTEYNDPFNRPTRIINAKGVTGVETQTAVYYAPQSNPYGVTLARNDALTAKDRDAAGDGVLRSWTVTDGFGRAVESWTRHPQGDVKVSTIYDGLGRISQTSNPYRNGETPVYTTTAYDLAGRGATVTTPDGATVSTAYNGNQTTVTDQAGKKRRGETDAFGRLVKVTEDPGVLNYETTYFYDPLGNLRSVYQGAQGRWFAYDSLSRLIRVRNPEQNCNPNLPPHTDPFTGAYCWSTAYSYDANGNIVSKTDARNITTTYGYDGLNRNTTVSYSDSTPGITRTYDTATLGKGRLQKTETAGSMGSRVTINAYDAMGRPLSQSQQFFYLGAWGTSYTTQQTYNLAGAAKTLTYPSGHAVNYSHDQAGRLSGFSGNLGGSPSTYADLIGYNAAGQMIKERFVTNTSLYHNLHYNNRLQLVDTRLGDSATDEWNWSRGATSFLYGTAAVANGDVFANDADNNGNLRRQTNYVPLAGGGNVIPQQQDYYYDALNRVDAVREQQRNANGQWADSVSQVFSYDRWGNRTLDLSVTGSGEAVWVDDTVPAGSSVGSDGGDTWTWAGYSPAPYSGSVSHQSNVASGFHQHGFVGASQPQQTGAGDQLYTYVYLDPANPPSEIMLQWRDASGSWEHRAYWGANVIDLGTVGTNSRRHIGPLPAAGVWVRLEVPANAVGLQGAEGSDEGAAYGMAFTLYGGRANWDQAGKTSGFVDMAWVEDGMPAGATGFGDGGDGWNWVGAIPSPHSGAVSHQSSIASGVHQHYFYGATQTLQVNARDRLYAYIYLDPANPPSEVMLQWNENGSWEHRAYWGANNIGWGVDGTSSRRYMGPLPAAGGWVRLEVDASAVGLEYKTLNGMAFTLYGGRAYWDKAGKAGFGGPPINNGVYTVDASTNRLTSVNGVAMSYDAAGNQTNDGSGPRTYDGENRMVTATNGGVSSSYTYAADGRRVRRIIGGVETWQVYGIGGELLAEYAAGAFPSAAQKEYGYRGGQMLVVWDWSETGDRQLQWLVQDHLGSTRMVVDRSGSLGGVRRHDFAPFGEELSAGVGIRSAALGYGADSTRQKFTGYEHDDETGLDFAQARYYASVQGRFTSVDPLMASATVRNPQTWNRYAYVLNNPLTLVDPDGTKEISVEDCKNDPKCTTIKLNVIYDTNSNKGKGLTPDQKAKFEKQLLQHAKDTYGVANVAFDVSYQEGQLTNKGVTAKIDAGAINVIATTQSTITPEAGVSFIDKNSGNAFSVVNVAHSDTTDRLLSHEISHHLLGDTLGSAPGGFVGNFIANAFADEINNNAIEHLRRADGNLTEVNRFGVQYYKSTMPYKYPLEFHTPFTAGASKFQKYLNNHAANRPRQ